MTPPYTVPEVTCPESPGSFPSQTLYLGLDIQVSRVTPFRPCTYGHMSSLQNDVPPKQCTWGHMSTVSKVTPSPNPAHLSLVHSLQSDLTPDPAPGVTRPVSKVTPPEISCVWNHMCTSPGWPHFPDPVPVVTLPQSPGWPQHTGPCTWGHMSTVCRVTLSQTLYLGSHIYSPLGDPSQTLYLESHIHSLHGDPFPSLATGLTIPQSPGWLPSDHSPGVTYPHSPGWPTQSLSMGSHINSLQGDTPPLNAHFKGSTKQHTQNMPIWQKGYFGLIN